MKDLLAAGRYARALFDIVRLIHQDEEVEAELANFSAALKSSGEIERFLGNPHFNTAQKRKFLQRLYQGKEHEIYKILIDFFTLLLEKNRFYLIHEIAADFKRIADEAKGQGTAQIRTAVPIDSRLERAIVAGLEKIAGYKIKVERSVDPSLIGGVLVKIKNKVLDGSIRHKIDLFKKELTRASVI